MIEFTEAPDVKKLVEDVIESLGLFHIISQFIYCYRSKGSRSKSTIARIYGLSKVWQRALREPPSYVIEVISERYDSLSEREKKKTVIHELLHIPKNFSGGLRPHNLFFKKQIKKVIQDLEWVLLIGEKDA
jgi:predicted metallopeptidase